MKFLKSRSRAERLFLAGGVALLAAVVVGSAGASQTVTVALGFASAGLMLVGFGIGMYEVFFRPND